MRAARVRGGKFKGSTSSENNFFLCFFVFFSRTAIQSQTLTLNNFIFKEFKINQCFVISVFEINWFQIPELDLRYKKVSSVLVITQQIPS